MFDSDEDALDDYYFVATRLNYFLTILEKNTFDDF